MLSLANCCYVCCVCRLQVQPANKSSSKVVKGSRIGKKTSIMLNALLKVTVASQASSTTICYLSKQTLLSGMFLDIFLGRPKIQWFADWSQGSHYSENGQQKQLSEPIYDLPSLAIQPTQPIHSPIDMNTWTPADLPILGSKTSRMRGVTRWVHWVRWAVPALPIVKLGGATNTKTYESEGKRKGIQPLDDDMNMNNY